MFDDESPARLFIGVPGARNAGPPDERRRAAHDAGGGIWWVWVLLLALGLLYGIEVLFSHMP